MLKNLLQRIFNFGQPEETNVMNGAANEEERLRNVQRKRDLVSECRELLHIAQDQRIKKRNAEVLITLERIVEIMEREGL